jgi:LPS export ABC transporter protein LptC
VIAIRKQIRYVIPALVAGFFFVGCTNRVDEVNAIAEDESAPDEVMDTVYSVLTDMGKVKFTMRAPRIEKFYGNDPKTWFPKGVEVEFYDSLHRKEAVLTANRAMVYDAQRRIELHGDVVLRNLIKEQAMFTEELIWEQGADSSVVHSDKTVRVEDEGNIYIGKRGIIADETFSWYEIRGFSADMAVPDSTRNQQEQPQ